MCPQQLDHKPHNHPANNPVTDQIAATGGHRRSQKRCSHPLCNSQQTHNHHHNNQQTPTTGCRPGTGSSRPQENPTDAGCFLRTQQGVHRHHQPHPPFPFPPHGLDAASRNETVGCTRPGKAVVGDDSPVSPPSSTPTPHPGAAGPLPAFAGRCSLERR
jgi:hypothetical protein